ncbi:nucleotidyl transferase AbiEii/AbiGii toxin family protein [Dysgonomonas sp. 25]|uniref:nucleotidyl transferase AbiEii/AbiGii toxin family protein n=1 Tax=Dysgonomonas sp. 25 TaxID=2302933 RepID=UPI0013D15A86|nr:nucleotidyl transferase AbiEii/AbiGii toxin family protein [Dysgonomonas sp. 25]NDV68743.1 hypothetical protein [Dysgonomonas sp. 25]
MDKALVERTLKVIKAVSEWDSIKPYILVGGTALSLQLAHRLSEDLDFMRWQNVKNEKMGINIGAILADIKKHGHTLESQDIYEANHYVIGIDGGVKISFYAPEKRPPKLSTKKYLNNIVLADEDTIASLKMETLMRRTFFRDYYDLYCILRKKSPEQIKSIIDNALKYSGHQLKSKNLIGILANSERFNNDSSFEELEPKYKITAKEIQAFMIEKVKAVFD